MKSLQLMLMAPLFTVAAGSPAFAQASAPPASDAPEAADQARTNDDIVVTATRTGATRLQDTALAITAIDAATFERRASRDIRDLQAFSPSLTITQNSSNAQPYIRGIGSNNSFPGSDPSTTLYIDGVYIARPGAFFVDLFEVERIEVLRGPQGTLYGRNSVGGAISVFTRRPDDSFQARAQLTLGNYDLARIEAYVSAPIVSGIAAFSLSGRYSSRDDYFANIGTGGGLDNEDDRSVRGQLRLTPADGLELVIRGDYSDSDATLGLGQKPRNLTGSAVTDAIIGRPRTLAFNTPANSTRRIWGVSAELNYRFSDAARLTSIVAYRDSRYIVVLDSDFSTNSIRFTAGSGDRQHQFSSETNLTGTIGDLTYVAGLYYIDEAISSDTQVNNLPATRVVIQPRASSYAVAGYAQGTYAVTPELSLTAGIRYTHERKEFDQSFGLQSIPTGAYLAGFPVTYLAEATYNAWTPKFGVEYRPQEGLLLYASATRGYKSGGFSFTSANRLQGFAPETLWAYEAGIKSDLFGRRLRLNLTGFYYDYVDLQVQSFLSPGVIDITNAATARVKGVELETRLRVGGGFSIGAAITYLDARYSNYPSAIGPGNIAYDASGNLLNAAPHWAYNFNAEYDHELASGGSLFGRVDFSGRSLQYFTQQNIAIESQRGYGLLSANLGFRFPGERFQVSVFGRNLTQRNYASTTATIGGVTFGTLGAPRTFGVQLSARY